MKGVLATRRRRADRNQGRVKASANLGRGTTAVLVGPRIAEFAGAVSASAEARLVQRQTWTSEQV
jgi:hypothetical protein